MNEDAYGKWTSPFLSVGDTSSFLVVFSLWNMSFPVFFSHFETNEFGTISSHTSGCWGGLPASLPLLQCPTSYVMNFGCLCKFWYIQDLNKNDSSHEIKVQIMYILIMYILINYVIYIYFYTKLHNIYVYTINLIHISQIKIQFHTSLTHLSGQAVKPRKQPSNAFQIDQGVYLPKASGCCWDAYVSWIF